MIAGPPHYPVSRARPGRPRRRTGRIVFWLLVACSVALAMAGAVYGRMSTRDYTDPSAGMQATIRPGDRLLVTAGTAVRRGDVIVFRKPATAGSAAGTYVKRLIGLAGDHVACCGAHGRVTVDGRPLDETYINPGARASASRFSVTVPPGRIWVLGDNRRISVDSRAWGPVPASGIVGRVAAISRHRLSVTPLHTPRTFVANGLAPPDHRLSPYLLGSGAVVVGVAALVLLALAGIIGSLIRRARYRRYLRSVSVP